MADVLELTTLVLTGSCRQRWCRSLERLDPRLLVARDHVRPRSLERCRLSVDITDLRDLLRVLYRILDLGVEPVL